MRRIGIFQAVTFVLLLVAVSSFGYQQYKDRHTQRQIARLARDGKQAHDGLCILKADLASRIKNSRDYLKTHPEGIAGISRADILKSIANQQSTLDSLRPLVCVPPARPPR